MKIIYISSLPQTMSGGPKYSVPNQVNAQSNLDDVVWINTSSWGVTDSKVPCEQIKTIYEICNRIQSFLPDLVVFEDLYYMEFYKIGRFLKKNRIPYIIKPRGCLTYAAQKQKWYKKIPANVLFFYPLVKHAAAIEYLTQREFDNSGKRWNRKGIIVPNGTSIPSQGATPSKNKDFFRGTFIGRINLYHKGLDVFFEVCGQLKDALLQQNCKLDFYGPYPKCVGDQIQEIIKEKQLAEIVTLHKEIHGKEKEQVLLSSDFFILTSRFEGLPMGLLEALSYGLPALVTDETNLGELIMESGAGFSSDCCVESIKQNLKKVLDCNNQQLLSMSEKAVRLAHTFDWNEIAEKAHLEYLELIGKER